MNRYRIGLVDEDPVDLDYIKRTILINMPNGISKEQVDFLDVPLPNPFCESMDSIIDYLVEAIAEEKIQLLIVDYKIVVSTKVFEGTEIFKRISDIVPKFPLIMLSNLSNDCYDKVFVDADKVYSKKGFFAIAGEYSKEKVANIFRNMDKYLTQRAKLTTQLTEQLTLLETDEYSAESIRSIIETETDLDCFTPQKMSKSEKGLPLDDLKEAVDILRNAQELIEERNEN